MMQSNTTRNRKEEVIRNLKYNYDSLNDLLYVYKKDSSVFSNVMIGDFHLEFTKLKSLVGIEILNASDILAEYGISKENLEHMNKVELKVVIRRNSLLVFLVITSEDQTKSATIAMNNLETPIMDAIAEA